MRLLQKEIQAPWIPKLKSKKDTAFLSCLMSQRRTVLMKMMVQAGTKTFDVFPGNTMVCRRRVLSND